ncbi:hypothetical protein JKP88DRAFT_230417 [Tribonema minus]|uniref:Uncharacterized protein n=1 Tax=Tribonema minus TaxID=303371 RepID=A0A835ZFS0_9STRA|nr:hypothetical protein JKP88DRAFT_230417 [Tribonema minus]
MTSSVDCGVVFDLLWRCATPRHQFASFYRWGKYDDCDDCLEDMKTCLKAKFTRDEAEAQRVYNEGAKNPTRVIWELKEKPGWDDTKGPQQGVH